MPGPAPKKHARFGTGRAGWVVLPVEGRTGHTPAWPLSGRSPAGWADLWRKPQAVMWEKNGDEFLVARYLKLRNMIQDPDTMDDVNAAALSELRQMEDRLGLSPMAMKRLQWEMADVGASAAKQVSGKVTDISDRFKSL